MTAAVAPSGRLDAWAAADAVSAGLAIAARSPALTFIAVPLPVRERGAADAAQASAIAGALDQPRAAWSTHELTVVGIGVARELRGRGADRFAELVRGARALEVGGAVIAGAPCAVEALGGARPRLIGGAAFAPGTADRAPWSGFGDAWFMLPRWTYVVESGRPQLVLAVDAADASDPVRVARWHAELATLFDALAGRGRSGTAPAIADVVEVRGASADQWRAQVTEITAAIARHACEKIVAARTCTVALAAAARPADVLAALEARHADCVRILIQPPDAGALVAATPERLIRRDDELVRCDALAGTRSIADGEPASVAASALQASAKDRLEHALVVQAIRAALTACLEIDVVDAPDQPDVRALHHIVHLHTPFRARLRAPLHVLELAARLHPTPAVGGTPRDVAVDWICRREPVARGWYAAPVGWFDLDGNGELAVAIRSGLIAGQRAHLWAGAGIVAGSDPDRELAETELKFGPMRGALGVVAAAAAPGRADDREPAEAPEAL